MVFFEFVQFFEECFFVMQFFFFVSFGLGFCNIFVDIGQVFGDVGVEFLCFILQFIVGEAREFFESFVNFFNDRYICVDILFLFGVEYFFNGFCYSIKYMRKFLMLVFYCGVKINIFVVFRVFVGWVVG